MNSFTNILDIFIALSFYCCLSGTVLTLILFAFSFKYTKLKKPIKKLATFFAIIWLLNITANFIFLFISPEGLILTMNNRINFIHL